MKAVLGMGPAMGVTFALLASIGAFALLVVLVTWLQRKVFLIRQLAFPLWVAAAAAGLVVFILAAPAYRPAEARQLLVWLLVFCGIALVLRLLGLYLFDIHLYAQKGVKVPPLLTAVTMALIYLITGLITLRLTVPNLDVTPLVATSAVTSLVLGLALQPILSNFFAGLVISVERPFRINDWIRVGEQEGRVVTITWRTTHLRTRDNDNLVIPNSKMADERVLNYYYPHPTHMERIKVGADYKTPPYRVRRALLEAIAGVPGALDKPSPDVYVLSFDDNAILYELRVWIEDMAQAPRIASDIRARIWEEFKKAGITTPHPIRTLELPPRSRSSKAAADGPRPAHLYIAEGPDRGQSFTLDGETVTIGRSRDCTLRLNEPNASKDHLKITWEDGDWMLTDLASSFGTKVNGDPTTSRTLAPLDRITIGTTVIIFESEAL
jgi:small-conductance mechanosensitive channel